MRRRRAASGKRRRSRRRRGRYPRRRDRRTPSWSASLCQRRRSFHASSPITSINDVEPTMSVKRNVSDRARRRAVAPSPREEVRGSPRIEVRPQPLERDPSASSSIVADSSIPSARCTWRTRASPSQTRTAPDLVPPLAASLGALRRGPDRQSRTAASRPPTRSPPTAGDSDLVGDFRQLIARGAGRLRRLPQPAAISACAGSIRARAKRSNAATCRLRRIDRSGRIDIALHEPQQRESGLRIIAQLARLSERIVADARSPSRS